jgi:menaquinone-dependent protoporphyrinogen oxidase
MNKKILVTYASETGSTKGVAETIGNVFADGGMDVDVLAMGEVGSLAGYDAVVAGSAVQGKAWLPEGIAFVQENQDVLREKPFAAFLVCMTLAMKDAGKYEGDVRTILSPVQALVPTVSEGVFAGELNLRKIKSLGKRVAFWISVLFGVWEKGDHRDWDAIKNWAAETLPLLISE